MLTIAELEAANWQALARYEHAKAAPRAVTSRCQETLIGELTRNAVAFAAPCEDSEEPADPVDLLREAIAVLAEAMGEPPAHLRARAA